MKTNTCSTDHPSLLPLEPYDELRDYVDDLDQGLDWPPRRITRTDLMAAIDDFGETPSGRRVLHSWADHELLADAVQLIADAAHVDALLLRPRDLAAAFGTDLFDELHLGEYGRVLLPDRIAAFVPYAHALRGSSAADTAASLAVIEGCRAAFADPADGQAITRFDPWRQSIDRWRPPPPPTPRQVLINEVGSEELLASLTPEPLPDDEAVDLDGVADDVRDRLRGTLAIADPVVARVFGAEHQTAVRRLLVDAIAADPDILRRKGRIDTLAAGACLAVARADRQLVPEGLMKASTLAEEFGLTSAPSSREITLQKAVAGCLGYGRTHPLPPRYLTGRRRTELVQRREELASSESVPKAS